MSTHVQEGKSFIAPIFIALIIAGIVIGSVVYISPKKTQDSQDPEPMQEMAPIVLSLGELYTFPALEKIEFYPVRLPYQQEEENAYVYSLDTRLSQLQNRRALTLTYQQTQDLFRQKYYYAENEHVTFKQGYASHNDEEIPYFITTDMALNEVFPLVFDIEKNIKSNVKRKYISAIFANMAQDMYHMHQQVKQTQWEKASYYNLVFFSTVASISDPAFSIMPQIEKDVQKELAAIQANQPFVSTIWTDKKHSIALSSIQDEFEQLITYIDIMSLSLQEQEQAKAAVLASMTFSHQENQQRMYKNMVEVLHVLGYEQGQRATFHLVYSIVAKHASEGLNARDQDIWDTIYDELSKEKQLSWIHIENVSSGGAGLSNALSFVTNQSLTYDAQEHPFFRAFPFLQQHISRLTFTLRDRTEEKVKESNNQVKKTSLRKPYVMPTISVYKSWQKYMETLQMMQNQYDIIDDMYASIIDQTQHWLNDLILIATSSQEQPQSISFPLSSKGYLEQGNELIFIYPGANGPLMTRGYLYDANNVDKIVTE